MRTMIALTLAALVASTMPLAARPGLHEVHGVDKGDMLKMRAGIGTGYRVILGLPNGTKLRVTRCEASGNVQWCKVVLNEFRQASGWVSGSYIRPVK